MVKPEKFGHSHLVYHFTVPLCRFDDCAAECVGRRMYLFFVGTK